PPPARGAGRPGGRRARVRWLWLAPNRREKTDHPCLKASPASAPSRRTVAPCWRAASIESGGMLRPLLGDAAGRRRGRRGTRLGVPRLGVPRLGLGLGLRLRPVARNDQALHAVGPTR